MKTKQRALILILLVAAGSAAVVALALYSSTSSCSLGNSALTVHFTIIESSLGYNDSKNHASSWPVITVHCGQLVKIHVQNNDTAEPHGFQIDHYFEQGVPLGPGESFDVKFNATVQGSFRFFCKIPCVVHQFMLNGQLIVVR